MYNKDRNNDNKPTWIVKVLRVEGGGLHRVRSTSLCFVSRLVCVDGNEDGVKDLFVWICIACPSSEKIRKISRRQQDVPAFCPLLSLSSSERGVDNTHSASAVETFWPVSVAYGFVHTSVPGYHFPFFYEVLLLDVLFSFVGNSSLVVVVALVSVVKYKQGQR